jgi:hypothetical protein
VKCGGFSEAPGSCERRSFAIGERVALCGAAAGHTAVSPAEPKIDGHLID